MEGFLFFLCFGYLVIGAYLWFGAWNLEFLYTELSEFLRNLICGAFCF